MSNNKTKQMQNYLTTLIEEKGQSTEGTINIDGHIGLTWQMLIDYIEQAPQYHNEIKSTLVKIDFLNGDIFHYLTFLAKGMLKAIGY